MARVAGIYVVGAWISLQVADVIGPALGFPSGTVRVLFWVALVGLAVIVALTWIFERTPEGLRLDPADVAIKARAAGDPRRLMVLPFRVLRPDAETDFLAFSLPDAITCNLSGLRSLVVRSSVAASRYDPTTDLRTLSREAGVDVVLTGSLLRSNGEIEVRAQLSDVVDGTLLWSTTSRAKVASLFELQEEVTRRVVDSLALEISPSEERQLRRDHPASARAYELYLRANPLSYNASTWAEALDLYQQCVREDPVYAPAWARAGRCHRLLAKYAPDEATWRAHSSAAEQAFLRALQLNPEHPLTQALYSELEIDTDRAEQAMTRLLGRLETSGNQPDLLVGLVQACRYCGLLDASIAAHMLAMELDPQARTGGAHTYFMAGDYQAALGAISDADIGYSDACVLAAAGRGEEALVKLREREAAAPPDSPMLIYFTSLRALLEGKNEESVAAVRRWASVQRDAEGMFYTARQLARVGAHDDALDGLDRSFAAGYFCPAALRDPWLDPLRGSRRFEAYVERVRSRSERARVSFEVAGGPKLLGVPAGRATSPP